MQTSNRLLDDLARVANGAVSALVGIRGEIESLVRQQIERLLAEVDAVPRDEFEAVKTIAARARSEQEKLEKRVAALEAKLGAKAGAQARPAKATAKPAAKPAAKTAKAGKGGGAAPAAKKPAPGTPAND